MNAIAKNIKLNLIVSTIIGLVIALFFIFLPNIVSILPVRISNIIANVYSLNSWPQLMPLFIAIFFVGLVRNVSALYSNKIILFALLLLDIVQILLFLFLFLNTPFFNSSYLYISKPVQVIFVFVFSIVFGSEIIGDVIKLIRYFRK
ncbi:hypothetical protein J2Z60_000680 [Lactobacillus colini]|uniref:Uncharacterized protein n=1 Tax=Lactobacillus colini TaxID=1819254 RepID=A0ABS4MCW5_9LACO|nr:hypothetical protein [Lactobacillus colini]MBP2057509.1 hypothetical protein [Lactobacillus colini]